MSIEIKLPELGEGVTEGELVKWLVKVGDSIKADQPIAEFMTDKATVEVPTPTAGVVKALKAKEGDVIKVEQTLIEIEAGASASASVTAPTTENKKVATPPISTASSTITAAATSMVSNVTATKESFYPPVAESQVLATPATRRLARELSVDINQMKGSGLAGRVTREDVMQNQSSTSTESTTKTSSVSIPRLGYQGPAGAIEERVPLRGIRKKIAENLQMAKHIIPHFTLMDEANVSQLVKVRESIKNLAEKEGTKITYLPFVMKALIATIRQYPQFNASIDDAAQEIVYKKYFNLGFAADR